MLANVSLLKSRVTVALPTAAYHRGMEYKQPFDQLYDPHKKAQDAIDHAREVRENRIAELGSKQAQSEPHLITDGTLRRCSACGYPFQSDEKPSMSVAFAAHLLKAHKPGSESA